MPEQQLSSTERASLRHYFEEPYRIFFPLGIFWSLVGVLYWVPKAMSPALEAVSTKVHVFIQVYGFMWCFVLGFLMTAIPHFTKTRPFAKAGLLLQLLLSVVTMTLLWVGRFEWAHPCFLLSSVALTSGLCWRMTRSTRPIPPSFLFIPFGACAAVLGSAAFSAVLHGFRFRVADVAAMANNLITQGVMLIFLLGVGGFLIESILRVTTPMGPSDVKPSARKACFKPATWHVLAAALLLLSYPMEAFVHAHAAMALRALIVTLVCVLQIGIHQRPSSGKLSSWWLWAGLWMLVLGLWGEVFLPDQYRLGARHLVFMGGFSYSIFAVATRVILSHAGQQDRLVGRYWPFTTAAILMLIGLVTRVLVEFIPMHIERHFAYAAGCWGLGVLLWSAFVLVRVTRYTPEGMHE